MVDVDMPEMDCFEFIKCAQLIIDIPIILMSSTVKREMVEEAMEQGACFILTKPISTKSLMNVWQHFYRHQIKASQKSEYNTSCANKKTQDSKGKCIVNPSQTYQDQEVGSLLEKKNEAKESKRMREVLMRSPRHQILKKRIILW